MCGYNCPLRHNEKETEMKLKSKSRYSDRYCNRIVLNNAIRRQNINISIKIS